MEIKEYKCPNCSGAVKFDSSIQKMKCPYCDAEFEITALDEYQKELSSSDKDTVTVSNGDTIKVSGNGVIKIVVKGITQNKNKPVMEDNDLGDLSTGACPSCGAELVGDNNTIAMVCPCCGNSQIVRKRVEGLLRPEYVIPFQLEKDAAVSALKKFYQGKKLLPNIFKEENRVNSIQGLYVPFWLYDAKAQGRVNYKATKTKAWSDSNYKYIKTDFFSVIREGSLSFEKIPVDGSEKMNDDYMDAIEPFDYTKIKDFKTAYLSGYIAEKYDVDDQASKERAISRIKNSIEAQFAKTVQGYVSVTAEKSAINIEECTASYALFPVWVLNSRYNKENFQFIMNGQSGLIVGKLPIDKGKVNKYRFLFTTLFGVGFTLIIQLLRIFM
ncbi:MAG: hypothetical protein FWE72_09185 [Spirochaetaceae bacterium]|nr:hypothetical protein [Spirochaetaceae bacterium]